MTLPDIDHFIAATQYLELMPPRGYGRGTRPPNRCEAAGGSDGFRATRGRGDRQAGGRHEPVVPARSHPPAKSIRRYSVMRRSLGGRFTVSGRACHASSS